MLEDLIWLHSPEKTDPSELGFGWSELRLGGSGAPATATTLELRAADDARSLSIPSCALVIISMRGVGLEPIQMSNDSGNGCAIPTNKICLQRRGWDEGPQLDWTSFRCFSHKRINLFGPSKVAFHMDAGAINVGS